MEINIRLEEYIRGSWSTQRIEQHTGSNIQVVYIHQIY